MVHYEITKHSQEQFELMVYVIIGAYNEAEEIEDILGALEPNGIHSFVAAGFKGMIESYTFLSHSTVSQIYQTLNGLDAIRSKMERKHSKIIGMQSEGELDYVIKGAMSKEALIGGKIGGAIGTALLPGIGSVIGAAIGGGIGGYAKGEKEQRKFDEAFKKLDNLHSRYVETLKGSWPIIQASILNDYSTLMSSLTPEQQAELNHKLFYGPTEPEGFTFGNWLLILAVVISVAVFLMAIGGGIAWFFIG